MDYLEYKGYKGSVEYSKEDNCLIGKVQGMGKETIIYEGETLAELEEDFRAGVDSYLDYCESEGISPKKPFSGRIILRMSPELHGRVAVMAKEARISLNEMINRAIIKGVEDLLLAR